MKSIKSLIAVFACVLMTACAGTASKVQTDYRPAAGEKFKVALTAPESATQEGLGILRARLDAQLASNKLLAGGTDSGARTLEVAVTNYYIRHGATRAMVGILAGADNVTSNVQIKDPASGRVVSQFTVVSKNPTAWGTSRNLLEEHADKIVATLTGDASR